MKNRAYEFGTEENVRFLQEQRNRLRDFGRRFPSPGGSSYYLGDDGTPWKERPRETWITSRMAHVYSLCIMLDQSTDPALVDAALRGLTYELKDAEHGGWFPGVQADGTPLKSGKQCYAHAFVILAASSALLAGRPGAETLLQEALSVYDRYFWDEAEGMARDTWNMEFTELDTYRGLNANMHSVEAFLAAADAAGNALYRERAGRIIRRVIAFARENHWRIPEHYTENWGPDLECNRERPEDPFKPYGATPGHGIEWARLILQYQQSICDSDTETSEQLYQRAVSDAWMADGAPGLVYTTDWNGIPVVHDRMHWTLAEAINTSAVLYRVTGKRRYAEDYYQFMEYLDRCVIDHEKGSWFHQLDRENHLTDSVWPGKSDLYHAFQATLIPLNPQVGVSIAAAIHSIRQL